MGFQLVIAEGKEAGREFAFDQPSVTVGRTSECDVILYDAGVSRKHARLFSEGSRTFVEDLGSSNGTKVNGALIQKKTALSDGDALTLGSVVFNFTGKSEEVTDSEPVVEQHTRIVSQDQLKRSNPRAAAFAPADARTAELDALARSSTTSLPSGRARQIAQPLDEAPDSTSPGSEHPLSDSTSPGTENPLIDSTSPRSQNPLAAMSTRPRTQNPLALAGDAAIARPGAASARALPSRPDRGLSAADRARIKREGGGLSSLKIFWAEASAKTRSRIVIAIAAVTALCVFAVLYALLRAGESAARASEPNTLSETAIKESFGVGPGVDFERSDSKVFDFTYSTPLQALVIVQYQARDVSPGEVIIAANGVEVGKVPPDNLVANEQSHEVIIRPKFLKKGERNQIAFDNVKNPPGSEAWRIWNVRMEVSQLPELSPDQLVRDADTAFRRGMLKFERRDIGAPNRYEAWHDFRNAWLMLEAHPDPKPELYNLAMDKTRESQQELDRICAKLLLEAQSAYNQNQFEAATRTLDHVKNYFPKNDQACGFRAEEKRIEMGL